MTGDLPKNPVFCAIDTPDLAHALKLALDVKDHVGGLKVGLEFFNHQGPDGVRQIVEMGSPVFTDLKFHDIPNTVAGAVRGIARLGPTLLNVHAAGGLAMMRAAKEAAIETAGDKAPLVIGVTLLTSLNETDLERQSIAGSSEDHVRRLAALTQEAGLDGVVCSAREIETLRRDCGNDFRLVVPGIRPAGSSLDDQKRVMTPGEALAAGADVLVIGRPITAADSPSEAARQIAATLGT